MAGYKQSVKNLTPKVFLTFDQDTDFNRGTGYLTAINLYDESGNGNNGVIDSDTTQPQSYAMGTVSLVGTEINSQQSSFTFAPLEYNSAATFPLQKTLIEIPSSVSNQVPNDFTVMFLLKKKQSSRNLMDSIKWDYTTSQYAGSKPGGYSYNRTIFRKGLQIGMQINMPWGNQESLQFNFPGYLTTVNISSLPTSFYNNTHHITMSHKVIQLGFGVYQSKYTVYYDGITIVSYTGPASNIANTALNTTSWQLGGNLDTSDPDYLNDRTTTTTIIDQFTIFDYALTSNQVMDCFKKTGDYYTLIKRSAPGLYIPFDDKEATVGTTMRVDEGLPSNATANYSARTPFTGRQTPTTTKIGGDLGVTFNNGMSYINTQNGYSPTPVINSSGDFTLEFWCQFQNLQRSVIFSCQGIIYPFAGLLIEANVRDGDEHEGSIQVSLNQNTYLCTPEFDVSGNRMSYADNVYRHYGIIRRGTTLELWIDGVLSVSIPVFSTTLVSDTGQLYLMGMAPGQLMTNGSLCHLVFYPTRALGGYELQGRAYFTVAMLLKGKITLQGVPYPGTVRIFDHNTGVLMYEYKAGADGLYSFNVYSNNYLDVMFFSSTDMNVRYQTVGPILATQYADVAWW